MKVGDRVEGIDNSYSLMVSCKGFTRYQICICDDTYKVLYVDMKLPTPPAERSYSAEFMNVGTNDTIIQSETTGHIYFTQSRFLKVIESKCSVCGK